jgi:RHS repeat-associated protein
MEQDYRAITGAYTAEFWMYDSRLLRRWEPDPITYDWQSPYACFNNDPISFVDPLGLKGERTFDPKTGLINPRKGEFKMDGAGFYCLSFDPSVPLNSLATAPTAAIKFCQNDATNISRKVDSFKQLQQFAEYKRQQGPVYRETTVGQAGVQNTTSYRMWNYSVENYMPYVVPGLSLLQQNRDGDEITKLDLGIELLSIAPFGKIAKVAKVGEGTIRVIESLEKIENLFTKNEFGRSLRKASVETRKFVQGHRIYKVVGKLKEHGLNKGDYFYLDGAEDTHIEVFNSQMKSKSVLNLDGSINLKKTASAVGRTIKL